LGKAEHKHINGYKKRVYHVIKIDSRVPSEDIDNDTTPF
jgi:hypothetical protein